VERRAAPLRVLAQPAHQLGALRQVPHTPPSGMLLLLQDAIVVVVVVV